MSQENVEIVRRYLTGLRERTPADIAEWVDEHWDEGSDFLPARKLPEARHCHGRVEITRFMSEFRGAFDRLEFEIHDVIALGDDRVIAFATISAQGRESGVSLTGDLYQCFWMRGGRFLRVEDHLTPAGALAAFGLEGESLDAVGN